MDPESEMLRITLVDSVIDNGDTLIDWQGTFTQDIPLPKRRAGQVSGHPADFPMRLMGREIGKQEVRLEEMREIIGARTSLGLLSGRYDWLDDQAMATAVGELDGGQTRLLRLRLEPSRRWASGFACFFFVWVGAPLAIWFRSAIMDQL